MVATHVDVWGHDAYRMSAAVTEKVPFKIEIVQPKVPIVRNGSMQLRVKVIREGDFKGAIALRALYRPSGIGASGSITIPADKDEASIPITANGGAAIGKWPFIVIGRSRVGNGNIEVASQMATLEISDTLVNFAFDKGAVELGKETEYVVKVTRNSEVPEPIELQLLGLPANSSTEKVTLAADAEEAVFKVKATEKARPGRYTSLVCRAVIVRNDEKITQTLGSGEIRIDKPIPPKVAQPEPKPQPKPEVVVEKKPEVKRLSRLEQLRLEKKQAQEK